MLRCPVCRAELTAGPNCRRCKADLTVLFALEEVRTGLLARAAHHVVREEGSEAFRFAEQAHALRADDDSLRLLALGRLLARDYVGALATYGARQ
jgi:hypothetical protein